MKKKVKAFSTLSRGSFVPIPIQSVTFWLNAFLPRDIAGYTTTLKWGPYAGLTAMAGPLYCLTDQRNFSNDIRARARMHSEITLDCSGTIPALTQAHRCDVTTVCDGQDGEVKCQRQASTSDMKFTLISVEPSVVIRLDCKASNPCAPASSALDDIDYKGTIVIDPAARRIAVDLLIDLFPAFEAYAAINGGVGAILFRHAPPAGILALRLPPRANRPIRARLEDHDGDGLFELPAPEAV